MALWTRLVYQHKNNIKAIEDGVTERKRSNLWGVSTLYQLVYLLILYINYPIFLFLILSGLTKMDFYHVALLFVFVWAALYPQAF
jgi:uncharacterized membrane protein